MEFEASFTMIGDDEQRTPHELTAESAAATVIAIDQQLYDEAGEPWERGERIGEAHGIAVTTHGGRVVCHLTFEIGDEDTIVAQGVLPHVGGSVGGGRIAVTGGTGRFHRASGTLQIESRNPKRYRFAV